jgi:hypothetical protein
LLVVLPQWITVPVAIWLLESWVRIPLQAWMFLFVFLCCVVLYRYRPLQRLIARPESPTKCLSKITKPPVWGGQCPYKDCRATDDDNDNDLSSLPQHWSGVPYTHSNLPCLLMHQTNKKELDWIIVIYHYHIEPCVWEPSRWRHVSDFVRNVATFLMFFGYVKSLRRLREVRLSGVVWRGTVFWCV